jgi:enoyl-CoA hydratase
LVRRTKATIAAVANIDDHPSAVERELVDQAWSVSQPEFQERLAAMRSRISGTS